MSQRSHKYLKTNKHVNTLWESLSIVKLRPKKELRLILSILKIHWLIDADCNCGHNSLSHFHTLSIYNTCDLFHLIPPLQYAGEVDTRYYYFYCVKEKAKT